MPFDFDSFTKLVNSPPGQLIAGTALAGIVYKSFVWLESLLTDMTKFEIAVWLVGVETARTLTALPAALLKLFNLVYGDRSLSLKCFFRSSVISICALFISSFIMGVLFLPPPRFVVFHMLIVHICGTIFSDYLSLIQTRQILLWMQRRHNAALFALVVLDVMATCASVIVSILIFIPLAATVHEYWVGIFDLPVEMWVEMGHYFQRSFSAGIAHPFSELSPLNAYAYRTPYVRTTNVLAAYYLSALLTSIWLWLYAGSGFLLKAARRFDIGFQWFNRKFDIEKKPLSAIGLVAGALVAVVYWGFALAHMLK